jgi:hypothetical protein
MEIKLCTRCKKEERRESNPWCKGCHAEYMRSWRAFGAKKAIPSTHPYPPTGVIEQSDIPRSISQDSDSSSDIPQGPAVWIAGDNFWDERVNQWRPFSEAA